LAIGNVPIRLIIPSSISLPFTDRHEAGRILASRLTDSASQSDVTVLGLARRGVPVGFDREDIGPTI